PRAAAGAAAPCGSPGPAAPNPPTPSPPASAAGVTVSAANVTGVGTILVNGQGRTLYMLTSEKGGKITCTDDNGCTKVWPDTELPKGMTAATAGPGIQAPLLGTVKNPAGDLYVTYHGWPLSTYTGDSGPGQAHGEAITAFGGTWYVLNTAGNPITTNHSQPSSGSGGNGY